MHRRMSLAVALVFSIAYACGGGSDGGSVAGPSNPPGSDPPPAPINLSGTGDTATSLFSLEGGFIVFTSQHSGDSNFIVRIQDDQGNSVELIVNEIGAYSGARGFSIPAGQYLLDVDADGSWSVRIEQPRPTSGQSTPTTLRGSGDMVWGPLQLAAGLGRFDFSHQGESNFIVLLYQSDGQRIALLANEIGDFSGSTAEGIPSAGLYFLDIQADGSWEIAVE